jgi:hypothetical protein
MVSGGGSGTQRLRGGGEMALLEGDEDRKLSDVACRTKTGISIRVGQIVPSLLAHTSENNKGLKDTCTYY